MKDFDALRSEREQRERSFKIAGREFTFRPALPAEQYSLYLEVMDGMREGRWPEGSFNTLNETILALLDDDGREAWKAVLADGIENPVSFEDMADVIDYCVSVQTGRPTKQLSASGTSGESASTRSTGGSGLQEVPRSQASISEAG